MPWSEVYAATIAGEPIGKGSVRVSTAGAFPRKYFPKKTTSWMQMTVDRLALTRPAAPFAGCLRLDLTMRFARPAKPPKGGHPTWCAKKPDYDNVCKAIGDALVKAGVILDDRLIVQASQEKLWAAPATRGALELRLSVWADSKEPF